MMTTLTVTAKGQVTLKQSLLHHLGIKAGQKINIDTLSGGRAVIRAVRNGRKIEDAFGMLKVKNKANVVLSVEDMNDITQKAWAGEQ